LDHVAAVERAVEPYEHKHAVAPLAEQRLIDRRLLGPMPRDEVLDLRGRLIPIHRLHRRFGIPADALNIWDGIVVIVEHSGKVSALLVDEMVSKQEVVIKNLGAFMQGVPGVSGGAILGDGGIALILDPGSLLQAA
jgi:two-component system chemotaxis sensor kinase CheA